MEKKSLRYQSKNKVVKTINKNKTKTGVKYTLSLVNIHQIADVNKLRVKIITNNYSSLFLFVFYMTGAGMSRLAK